MRLVEKMWGSTRKAASTKYVKILILLLILGFVSLGINLRQGGITGIKAPAVYLRATGGLGNQLFQYACAYTLARRNEWPLYVHLPSTNDSKYRPQDRQFALQNFNIPFSANNTDSEGTLINPHTVFRLSDFTILSGTHPTDRVLLIDEYSDCQSEHFFLPYKEEILKMFVQNIETKPLADWVQTIRSREDSVVVHIRRGDLTALNNRVIHMSYYEGAMKNISKMLKRKPSFFVFSDDMDYVKRELKFHDPDDPEVYFVSSPNTTSIQDFYLMSICDHYIIPTSTFSWWAAYRNPNPDKIIIAAHYHPNFFELAYAKLQWRHIYYPLTWITVDPVYEQTHSLKSIYSLPVSFPSYLIYFIFIGLSSFCLYYLLFRRTEYFKMIYSVCMRQ